MDGQVTVARLVAKISEFAGLPNTEIAFDTPTAREQMEARPPDIVILDARIAPMNATAFITLTRKLTKGQAVTLIDDDIADSRGSGCGSRSWGGRDPTEAVHARRS